MKKALIIGHTGQDGSLLTELLETKGYDVLGISSTSSYSTNQSIKDQSFNVLNYQEIEQLINSYQPTELYYLAAKHHSASNFERNKTLFNDSLDVNVKGLVNCLEAITNCSKHTRLFYASSSHIFGFPISKPQTEETPFDPSCIYGITKNTAMQACYHYRDQFGVYASIGIFYNHESALRASHFVSKKIVETAVAIKDGEKNSLILGDLNAPIDWGYAPDYMKAVHCILQLDKPDIFIISSGKQHTVKDFAEKTFKLLDLEWEKYVKVDTSLIGKKSRKNLLGDYTKLKKATAWQPETTFDEMINIMVTHQRKKYAC